MVFAGRNTDLERIYSTRSVSEDDEEKEETNATETRTSVGGGERSNERSSVIAMTPVMWSRRTRWKINSVHTSTLISR